MHTAAVNRSVGRKYGFRYLDHPPYSPDLHPIKNCEAILKQRYQRLAKNPTTATGMFEEYRRLWWEISQAIIDAMLDSMPRRLEEVRKRRGFAARY